MAELDRAGARIHYQVTGPGEAAPAGSAGAVGRAGAAGSAGAALPLLLTHGYGSSAAMWEPNLPALSAAREVITWDIRGHGRSGSPADPAAYTQAASVQDMAAVLDACGADRAVIGGLSLGGYLSLAFYLRFPHRVAALLLCDTGPGYRNDEARQKWNDRAMATAGRLERDGLAALGDGARSPDAAHWSASGLALAARGILTQHDGRVIEALPSVSIPALVVVGADDEPFLGAASYVAAKIPGARHVVIPGAGHVCNVDQPELFDRAVLEFLAQVG